MQWGIEFYQDATGNSPVQDFIRGQTKKVQAKILRYIDLLQDFGLGLGSEYVEKLEGSKLWELRIRHSSNLYRIFYFAFTGRKFVLVHAFLKKTKKTPKSEIAVAEARQNDYGRRHALDNRS